MLDGGGAIVEEGRVDHLRRQAVIRDGDDVTHRGQGDAEPAIVGLRSGIPAAAVEEDNHRQVLGIVRCIDVVALARIVAIADIARHRADTRILGRKGAEQAQSRTGRHHRRHAGQPGRQKGSLGHIHVLHAHAGFRCRRLGLEADALQPDSQGFPVDAPHHLQRHERHAGEKRQ